MHRAPRLFFVAALRFDRFGKPPFDTRAMSPARVWRNTTYVAKTAPAEIAITTIR